MITVNHIIVKTTKNGKKKYHVLHDLPLTPPRQSDQMIVALKQQFDLLSFTVEDGKATALVGKKSNEAE